MAAMHQWFGYYYYEKPDYDECLEKTWVCMKMAGAWGAVLTVNHLITGESKLGPDGKYPKLPKTYGYAVRSLVRYTGPVMSIAFLGASITCALANIRGKKDDCWNHMLGWGIPAGFVLNHVCKSSFHGAAYGFLIALAAGGFKVADRNDVILMDNRPHDARVIVGGTFAGDNWGDLRFGVGYKDPGRRPNN